MSEILDFRKQAEDREELIWKCNCGNCAFIIYLSGKVECSDCNSPQTVMEHEIAVRKWTRKIRPESESR